MFKSLIIFVQAVILFVVGVVAALLVGVVAGLVGSQWLDKKAQAEAEAEAKIVHERLKETREGQEKVA